MWVGADNKHHTVRQGRLAKQICWEECPVRRECLLVAIADNSKVIAGGLDHFERAELLRQHGGDRIAAVLASQRPEERRETA